MFFGMRMGDFGGFYLVKFIHLRAPYMIFEIFKNIFGMRMGDFGGVYLVTFIQILHLCVFFVVIFEFLKFSKMFFA